MLNTYGILIDNVWSNWAKCLNDQVSGKTYARNLAGFCSISHYELNNNPKQNNVLLANVFAGRTGNINQSTLQFFRFGPTCSTAATQGSVCVTNYSWPTPFADISYTVSCTLDGGFGGAPVINGIQGKTSTGFQLQIMAGTSAAASALAAECVAAHDF